MGKKVPDSGIEIRRHSTFKFDAVLYYGGGPSNVAHTVPVDGNGNDVRIPRSVFEPLLQAAAVDVALGAGGAVLGEALDSPNVPTAYGTWWSSMSSTFRDELVATLADTWAWWLDGR